MQILVVDKDPETRTLIRTRLEARGYTISEETSSEMALRFLSRESADVILLSADMEPVDGKLLIEWIRRTPFLTSVPVIMLSEEDQIAELVLSQKRGFDDFLMKPFTSLVLQLRIAMNIDRARKRIEANALTQLPGNPTIERIINEKIEQGAKYSVLYLDINNFKSFNDRYGFKKGDDVLRQTAKILVTTSQEVSPEDEIFIGHVGGDDFVSIMDPEHEGVFARAVIDAFDRLIPTYYSDSDRQKGTIRVVNRKGKEESFPLMSVCIAACTNLYRSYQNLGEIAQDAAEVKRFLKSQPGSHYLRDRRSAPIENFEDALEVLVPDGDEEVQKPQVVDPLGKTLLNAGLITEQQLATALKKNLETGKRLGEILISMKAVRSEDVGKMLEDKLKVPYICLAGFKPERDILRLFSRDFMRTRRLVPIESSKEGLRLAMCDPFDLKTLDAIERITNLKPIPCLALEEEFENFIELHLNGDSGSMTERTGS